MAELETLVVSFGANLAGLTAGVAGAKVLLAGFGLGVAALGVASIKMAGDFQAGVTTLKTGAGELQSNMGMVSQGILKMATDTGTSTSQLIAGMFQIESAGYRGANALNVMQVAAEGAKVGHADLGVTAKAVTGVMLDYGIGVNHATDAMNFLTAIVQNGQTNLQDLGAAMPSILPTASALGVQMRDVGAAMATMTAQTIPAADASTYLRQLLMALAAPAKAGQKALEDIGLSAQQVSDGMKKSLPDTLKLIMTHLAETYKVGSPQYVDALKNIAGGSKQMQGILDLTGSHLSVFGDNVKNISNFMNQGKGSIVGWSDVQNDFNFKIDQAKSAMEVLGITIGTKLLPMVGPLISDVANLVSGFTSWLNSGHAVGDALSLTGKYAQIALPILIGLGAIVLTVLVPAFWTWAAGVIAATWPLLAIGAAVGALVAIFVHFYQTNAGFKAFIDNIANGFKQVAGFVQANFMPAMKAIGDFFQSNILPVLRQVGDFLKSTFQPVWQSLVNLWNGQLMPLFKQLWDALQPLLPVLKVLGAIVGGIIVAAFILLVGIIEGVIKGFAGLAAGFTTVIGGIVQFITGFVQFVSGIITFLYDLFTGNFGKLGSDLGRIWQGIVNMFGGVWNVIKGIFQEAWGAISGIVSGFIGGILGFFGGFKDKVVSIFNNIKDGAGSAFNNLRNIISGVWNGIVGDIRGAINWIIGGIDNFIRGIDSIHVNVPGIGNVGFNIPTIPMLATGGSVPPGGMAIAGEAGPELVFGGSGGARVLSNSQSMGALGGNGKTEIHNHIYIDGRQMADSMMVQVVSQMRSSGHPVGSF